MPEGPSGGDPRFGGGARPPPVRTRGSARFIAWWGLALAAAGALHGYWGLRQRYAPDPIRWAEVGPASFDLVTLALVGLGVGLALLSPVAAARTRRD